MEQTWAFYMLSRRAHFAKQTTFQIADLVRCEFVIPCLVSSVALDQHQLRRNLFDVIDFDVYGGFS